MNAADFEVACDLDYALALHCFLQKAVPLALFI
jgi:hypothetical protein